MGRWLKRQRFLTLLLVAMLAAGLWWQWGGRHEEKKGVPVVKAGSRVLAEGIVYPLRYAQMVMPVDGTVGEVLVNEGDRVKVGQLLIQRERQDYDARVLSARSDVAQAAAGVEQARVNLADGERELRRQERMATSGATSRQELDQARSTVDRNQAALDESQADLVSEKAKLSEAEGLLDKTELRAPIDGTVAFLDVKVGEHAAAGDVLVRLADESAWEVRSDDLTELEVAKVQPGDAVALTFDGIPGLEIPGKVRYVRPYGEKKRGTLQKRYLSLPTAGITACAG